MSATVRAPLDLEDIRLLPRDGQDIDLYPIAKRVRAFFVEIAMAGSAAWS